MHYIQQPQTIEANSFTIISDIIRETRPDYRFASPLHEAIIKRVIHTTADFDWLDILWFSADALEQLCDALRQPCIIYTDTTMALSGINKDYWRRLAASVAVISAIRAWCAPQNAGDYPFNGRCRYRYRRGGENKLFVFGNAPTALFRLLEHNVTVSGVVGVPVGFVGAAESKEALTHSHFPRLPR